eukprot:1149101-Pelagomonas_calceolata.AAC.1
MTTKDFFTRDCTEVTPRECGGFQLGYQVRGLLKPLGVAAGAMRSKVWLLSVAAGCSCWGYEVQGVAIECDCWGLGSATECDCLMWLLGVCLGYEVQGWVQLQGLGSATECDCLMWLLGVTAWAMRCKAGSSCRGLVRLLNGLGSATECDCLMWLLGVAAWAMRYKAGCSCACQQQLPNSKAFAW